MLSQANLIFNFLGVKGSSPENRDKKEKELAFIGCYLLADFPPGEPFGELLQLAS